MAIGFVVGVSFQVTTLVATFMMISTMGIEEKMYSHMGRFSIFWSLVVTAMIFAAIRCICQRAYHDRHSFKEECIDDIVGSVEAYMLAGAVIGVVSIFVMLRLTLIGNNMLLG